MLRTRPLKDSFMFGSPLNPDMQHLITAAYSGHSGASYAITMRHMQHIAIHGWDHYVLKTRPASCSRSQAFLAIVGSWLRRIRFLFSYVM